MSGGGDVRWPPKGSTALQVVKGRDLAGRYILITGANAGIGLETARALASVGAHVTLACRNAGAAAAAREKILAEFPSAEVALLSLDLADLGSVEAAAAEYLSRGWPLHVLIANAGVVNPPSRVTDQGFEATFQINHLGHFYLVELLKEKLKESAPARIVIVSSEAHRQPNARLSPGDVTWERLSPTHRNGLNNAFAAYGLSKTANILHAKHLQAELGPSGVSSFSLHPGIVRTDVSRNSTIMKGFFALWRFAKTPAMGAATSVFCAVGDGLAESHGGDYFADCRPKATTTAANNAQTVAALAKLSEEMLEHYRGSAQKQS